MKRLLISLGTLLSVTSLATPAHSHGVLGRRFIPSTLAVEDPFASDE
jgi:hypothetical protein